MRAVDRKINRKAIKEKCGDSLWGMQPEKKSGGTYYLKMHRETEL